MFKKIIIALVATLFVMNLSAAETKIGVVDVKLILSKSPQVKVIGERVQAQYKSRFDALGALQKKGRTLEEKLNRDAMTLSRQQKRDIQRELKTIDNELKLKHSFLKQDMKLTNSEEEMKFYSKVKEAIEKISKDEKFDIILNKELVPYVNAEFDISDKVLKLISNPAS